MEDLKYKPGERELQIQMPSPPPNTSGKYGHYDDSDGIFIEWDASGTFSVVLLKDGVRYEQTLDEFVENASKS